MTAVDVDALDKLREVWAAGGWPAVDAMFAVSRALPELLAEVRRGRALREAVEGLAEEWRYKGEYGWGAWQEGHGPDLEGTVLEAAATTLRAVVAAVDAS